MIEQLFGSKTRVKLLRLFYSNPNRAFYVREITRKIDEQINSVRRELGNLLSIGIISSDNTNNRLYYEVNQAYEFYKPLKTMFGTGKPDVSEEGEEAKEVAPELQAAATADPMVVELQNIGNVEFALFTGQFTRDESSGVDMLIVGDVNQAKLEKFIAALEAKENKEIRYVVLVSPEFEYRQQVKDRFVINVLASKNQVLIDKRKKGNK